VPRIETLPIDVPLTIFKSPVPLAEASAAGSPERATVGFPDTPLPFVTVMPVPEAVSVRGTITPLDLTTMPSLAASRLPDVPLSEIVKGPCAPPFVSPIPVLLDRYRLLGNAAV
jgi:hypothetical protein